MRRLEFHPAAADEAEEVRRWHEKHRPHLVDAFVHEVESALSAVIEMPMAWPLYEDPARRYLLRRFPYAIIYVLADDALMVLAFAHTRRRPGYWRHRIDSE